MIGETIAVAINGVVFDEYASLEITNDVYAIGGSLIMSGTNPLLQTVAVGAVATAQIHGESVFTGLVETVAARHSKGSAYIEVIATDLLGALRRMQITRFKTYKKQLLMSVVRSIFVGVNVPSIINPVGGPEVSAIMTDEFSVERGESVADALASLCVSAGVICFCDNAGKLTISKPKGVTSAARHKINVGLDDVISTEYRVSSVNSWKIVQSHKQGEKTASAKTVIGADMYWLDTLCCYCAAADANKTKATAIAKLNECRNAGLSYTVNTAGVRCGNGRIWQINEICAVTDPNMLAAAGARMYVNSRNISFSKERGTVSAISMGMEPL